MKNVNVNNDSKKGKMQKYTFSQYGFSKPKQDG